MRLAIIFDYLEEDWQSMELCAQMLLEHLQSEQAEFLKAVPVRPILSKALSTNPLAGKKTGGFEWRSPIESILGLSSLFKPTCN
jgi:hypothetical protein